MSNHQVESEKGVGQETSTFTDFDGYEGDEETDATDDHDTWGVGE
ncbi:hypothetical protein [Halorussus lipolyticus]|nr:hypothetical protein [Halorussus sp. DT80]